MYVYFEHQLFKEFTAWFKHHVGEELSHAGKIIDYILERSGSPAIPATKAPNTSYASPLEAMKSRAGPRTRKHDGHLRLPEGGGRGRGSGHDQMLQWFVKEQVEEEQWAEEYTQMVAKIENSMGAMYAFDHKVGSRVNA